MAISTVKVAETFLDVTAGDPIGCDWPLFAEDEVRVFYGLAPLEAQLNVDFTVTLDAPNYDTFSITPTTALIDKINDLIADDAEEFNYITVRRVLTSTTSTRPESVRQTSFVSREFERIILMVQQLEEGFKRALKFPENVAADADAFQEITFEPGIAANTVPVMNEDGTRVIQGPLITDVQAAQGNAALALQYRNESRDARDESRSARDDILNNAGFIAVAADLTGANTIGAVAAQLAAVTTCATNIAAILAAPGYASDAANARDAAWLWAVEDEDTLVNDGIHPADYSAYHYAQKAAASAAGAITNLTGHVVANGPGSVAATIQPNVVTNAMLTAGAVDAAKAVIATQGEAEAGTDTTKLMNPLRVAQAIAALTPPATGRLLATTYYTCPQQNVTISVATPAVITFPSSGKDMCERNCPVQFTTTGALPVGLALLTTYYVLPLTANTANVSLTPNGSPVATTGAGSGTHTIRNAPYEKSINNPLFVDVEVVGGCGSGATTNNYAGGGGGGGARKRISASNIASSEVITSGVGGGGTGGTSSFGTHCSATGGAGANTPAANIGGVGSGGDLNVSGFPGYGGSVSHRGFSAFGYRLGGSAAASNPGVGEPGLVIVREYS